MPSEKADKRRKVREPRQQRGISQKEHIIEAAYAYVCAHGYSKLTTPRLARAAGISIGCLYGYFRDKDDLFHAVLDRYSQQFDAMREDILRKFESGDEPLRKQLYDFLVSLVAVHEASAKLNMEITQLSFRDQSMKSRLDATEIKVRAAIEKWLAGYRGEMSIADIETKAVIMMDLMSAIVHRVAFGQSPVPRDRLLKEGVNALVSIMGLDSI
jgi:AcrR family transcriptional regulator